MEACVPICAGLCCAAGCDAVCKSHSSVPIVGGALLAITFFVLGILAAVSVIGVGIGGTVAFFLLAPLMLLFSCVACCRKC